MKIIHFDINEKFEKKSWLLYSPSAAMSLVNNG